jgi:hypothetical protein
LTRKDNLLLYKNRRKRENIDPKYIILPDNTLAYSLVKVGIMKLTPFIHTN